MIALTALGNRLWGEGKASHSLGASLITLGLWDLHKYPLWAIPALFIGILVFRAWKDGAWLDETTGKSFLKALIRSSFILPLGWLLAYLNMSCAPIYVASGAIIIIPFIYWVCGKQNKVNSVELAEFLTGGIIGFVGLK